MSMRADHRRLSGVRDECLWVCVCVCLRPPSIWMITGEEEGSSAVRVQVQQQFSFSKVKLN